MNPRITALRAQFDEVRETINNINSRATTENRDLTDEEAADIDVLFARAEALKPEIETETAKQRSLDDLATVFAKVNNNPAAPALRADTPKNPGDYFFHFLRGAVHPNADHQSLAKVRALAVNDSNDSLGLLPYTIQGDIIRFVDASRRTIDSLAYFAMPAGASFKRRVESGASSVQLQSSENAEVASAFPTVAYVDVSHSTYAGGIRLTIQAENFNDPNVADLNLRSMGEQYAIRTNTVVAAALKAAATNTRNLTSSAATPQTVMQAIMGAADTVYGNSKTEADTIWVSPAVRTWLATMVGTDGHFAFPMLNPGNRDGVTGGANLFDGLNIGGLKVVVEPHFTSGTFVVGSSRWGEVYESMYPVLSAVQPSTLSREIAMAGELGTYIRAEGFVKIIDNSATPIFS